MGSFIGSLIGSVASDTDASPDGPKYASMSSSGVPSNACSSPFKTGFLYTYFLSGRLVLIFPASAFPISSSSFLEIASSLSLVSTLGYSSGSAATMTP